MAQSVWRLPAAYDYLERVLDTAFAWEYLRRHREYRRNYPRSQDDLFVEKFVPLSVPQPPPGSIASHRWGLRCPRRSGAYGPQCPTLLAA